MSGELPIGPIVDASWVAEHLDDPAVRVLDCRWYLRPFDERNGDDEYRAGHLPGAVHVRWDTDLADPDRPGMLGGADRFAAAMEAAGVGDDTFVVTYDDHHVPAAARVWWSLRTYGHDAVAVLDGGLAGWVAAGRPLSTDAPTARSVSFTPRFQPARYATKDDVLQALEDGTTRLLDGRMDSAWDLAGGHIPGATRLVGKSFLDDVGTWHRPDDVRRRFEQADATEEAIAYCGGGVAATAVALAHELAGLGPLPVYDGSWSEWVEDPATPKERHG